MFFSSFSASLFSFFHLAKEKNVPKTQPEKEKGLLPKKGNFFKNNKKETNWKGKEKTLRILNKSHAKPVAHKAEKTAETVIALEFFFWLAFFFFSFSLAHQNIFSMRKLVTTCKIKRKKLPQCCNVCLPHRIEAKATQMYKPNDGH